MNINNKLYENFHKNTSIQMRTINRNNFTYRLLLRVIEKYTKSKNIRNIIDIGCGSGTLSLYIGKNKKKVLGIDISKNAINSAKKSAKYLGLKNVSFKTYDFPSKVPDGLYDLVICTEVLEHIKNDNLALAKIFSILKPGGIAIMSTPSKNAPLHRLGLAKKFDAEVGHLRRYTLEDLIKKSKNNGFDIIETQKIEGIIRNFLFLNSVAGKLIRFIKWYISDIVTALDNFSLKLFGESNIIVVIKKPV